MDKSEQWVVTVTDTSSPSPTIAKTASELLQQWRAEQIEEERVAGLERPTTPDAPWDVVVKAAFCFDTDDPVP